MTDLHQGYTVVLKKDLRGYDAQPIFDAIKMM